MERPAVMGILNVTPDSFYDGGRYLATADAVARGRQMIEEGAAVVDVGGESSRPGAQPVDTAEELARVVPVVAALAGEVRLSVDTVKPAVAEAAVAAGATLINDISARLSPLAAELGVGWVAMHMQGTPRTMQRSPHYVDVVDEVFSFVLEAAKKATAQGVREVWLDPGIGFGKTAQHNLTLLRAIGTLVSACEDAAYAGVLIGTSRKSFLGTFTGPHDQKPLPVEERFEGSLATAVWAMSQGVAMVRVHDVAPMAMAARLIGGAVSASDRASTPALSPQARSEMGGQG